MRSKHPVKSLVVGRPILLALEDVNGAPSFLEKALRFLEQYGENLSLCGSSLVLEAVILLLCGSIEWVSYSSIYLIKCF